MRTLIKHVLAATEPRERSDRQGLGAHAARFQRVFLPGTQRRFLPGEPAGGGGRGHARRRAAAALDHRGFGVGRGQTGALAGGRARNGRCAPHEWSWSAPRTPPIRCRRKATRRSSCAPSPTCGRARICMGPSSASAAGWPTPCTSFSRSAISSMCTRRSSPPATAKAPAKCSGSPRSRATSTRNRKRISSANATYLTVSGQLEGETFACALSNIYTFGPTFRAENSNTARHAAEFWMIEPEMAFCDLQGDMDLGEEFIKAMARIRAGTLRGGPGVVRQVRRQRPAGPAEVRGRAALRARALHRGRRDPEDNPATDSNSRSSTASTCNPSTSDS